MKTETIKDIITARWKFIASNAEQISAIARKIVKSEELNDYELKQVRGYQDDNEETLKSLELLLKALDVDDWEGDEE